MPSDSFLGVTLPDQSILDAEDYERMYDAASDLSNMTVLSTLVSNGPMRPTDFGKAFSDVDHRLAMLNRVGLVSRLADGSYRASSLGRTVETHGPADGVRRLMENEREFEKQYS